MTLLEYLPGLWWNFLKSDMNLSFIILCVTPSTGVMKYEATEQVNKDQRGESVG